MQGKLEEYISSKRQNQDPSVQIFTPSKGQMHPYSQRNKLAHVWQLEEAAPEMLLTNEFREQRKETAARISLEARKL